MLNADEIRAIVREELREAFRMLATEADRFPRYETDTIEDTAARMLSQVAESTEDKLRHTPTCGETTVKYGHGGNPLCPTCLAKVRDARGGKH